MTDRLSVTLLDTQSSLGLLSKQPCNVYVKGGAVKRRIYVMHLYLRRHDI